MQKVLLKGIIKYYQLYEPLNISADDLLQSTSALNHLTSHSND